MAGTTSAASATHINDSTEELLGALAIDQNVFRSVCFPTFVSDLISKGADPTFTLEKTGMNVLMYACYMSDTAAVKTLLEIPAVKEQINQKDLTGNTALLLAVRQSDPYTKQMMAIFSTLLAHGADPSIKNSREMTALDRLKKYYGEDSEIVTEASQFIDDTASKRQGTVRASAPFADASVGGAGAGAGAGAGSGRTVTASAADDTTLGK